MRPQDTAAAGGNPLDEPMTAHERLRLQLVLAAQYLKEGRTRATLTCISDAEAELDEIEEL